MINFRSGHDESYEVSNLNAGWHTVMAGLATKQQAKIDRMLAQTMPIGPGPEAVALQAMYDA